MSWSKAPLGEVTKILSGTTPISSNPYYWGGTNVWVTPTDLGKLSNCQILSSDRFITDSGVKSCSLSRVPANSVVMSSRAPIGHLAIAGCELFTNQGCKSFVCTECLDPEFLFLMLKHRMPEIQALGSGATFIEVSKSALEAFEVSFPTISDQRSIAANLKVQLAEVEKARQAAEVQLVEIDFLKIKALGDVFNRVEPRRPIGAAAKVQSGFAFKSQEFTKHGIRLLRNTNISPCRVYWDDVAFVPLEEETRYTAYSLHENDILISLDRPIISTGIKVARIESKDLPALLVQRVGRFQLDKECLDANYLYGFLQTQEFIDAISGHDQSLGVPHISPTQIENIEIPLPSLSEQQRLALKIKEISQEIDAAKKSLEKQLSDISLLPSYLLSEAFASPSGGGLS